MSRTLQKYQRFLSPFEKILIEIQDKIPADHFKQFVYEMTGEPNIPNLSKKYGFEPYFLAIASKFTVQLAHYLIESELIAEKQKNEPVRLYFNVA